MLWLWRLLNYLIEYLYFHFHLFVHFKQNVTVKSHSHPAETANGRLVYLNFLTNFLKIMKDRLVKSHRFCMHCVPFILFYVAESVGRECTLKDITSNIFSSYWAKSIFSKLSQGKKPRPTGKENRQGREFIAFMQTRPQSLLIGRRWEAWNLEVYGELRKFPWSNAISSNSPHDEVTGDEWVDEWADVDVTQGLVTQSA